MQKLYSDKRWNDNPKAIVVKKEKLTKENKETLKELEKYANRCMKKCKLSKRKLLNNNFNKMSSKYG